MLFPPQAYLFDLDGVVLDTEPQYTLFWGSVGREYLPEVPHLEQLIKGQTLKQIYDRWFVGRERDQEAIKRRLDEFEETMPYPYVAGVAAYLDRLKREGAMTAVVTSSNRDKMESVYRRRPEVKGLFTRIFTSEDFSASKPSPDCYLTAARCLGVDIRRCVVFEDSINGLKSGRDSGAYVVALATTHPKSKLEALADEVVMSFEELAEQKE